MGQPLEGQTVEPLFKSFWGSHSLLSSPVQLLTAEN
jgi:hypothetical protein